MYEIAVDMVTVFESITSIESIGILKVPNGGVDLSICISIIFPHGLAPKANKERDVTVTVKLVAKGTESGTQEVIPSTNPKSKPLTLVLLIARVYVAESEDIKYS